MHVRVPASSANLGPGFDVLGMALSLYLECGPLADWGGAAPAGARQAEDTHPCAVAYRLAGGDGVVWVRSPIPMGRGLGFSGAARVAGLVAGLARCADGAAFDLAAAAHDVLERSTALEGHADNAAASLLGGVVAAAGGHAIRVPLGFASSPAVVAWVPSFTTSTDESRGRLPPSVSRADAVFNVGRAALLVAAFAAGDVSALRAATEDRLHQDARLARAEPSRAAIAGARDAGAWGAWLSGSGPTVAALCAPERATDVAAAMPGDGHTKLLAIDTEGAVVVAA